MDRRTLFTAGGTPAGRVAFTRRETLPVLAASLGAGLLAGRDLSAEPRRASATDAKESNRRARVYNVCDFGAKGDGTTLDTAALQTAIDACNEDGGGTVLVPAGIFLIGSLELKSSVTLYIAAGSKLLGSGQGKDFTRSMRFRCRVTRPWRTATGR